MHRWSECPGSIRLTRGIENVSSSYAAEGTVAHDIAAKVLNGAHLPGYLGQTMTADGHSFVVDEEMLEAVEVYVNHVTRTNSIRDVDTFHVIDLKFGAGKPVEVIGNPQLRYYALGVLLSNPSRGSLLIEHKFDLTEVYEGCTARRTQLLRPWGRFAKSA